MAAEVGQEPNGQPTGTTGQPPREHTNGQPAGISREEHERLLAQARKEEKDKLYPEIESHKNRAKKLEQERQDLETALESAQNEGRKSKGLEKRLEQVEQQLTELPTRFSKVMDDTLDNLKKEGETARQRDQLDARRRELVNSTTEVIPELVTGNTPEELNTSFESSKQRYKAIHDQAAEKTRKELESSVRGALPQPVTATGAKDNAGGQPNADALGGLEDWRKMAPSEWEAKKKQIKEEAFRAAGLPMKQGRS